MATTKTDVRAAVDRLAAATGQPLALDAYSPGDGWTRYRVVQVGNDSPYGERAPLGREYRRGSELVACIGFALAALHLDREPKPTKKAPRELTEDERGAVWELDLYAENTFALYEGKVRLIKRMQERIAKGQHNTARIVGPWRCWYDRAATMYRAEIGSETYRFTAAVKAQCARERADDEYAKILNGEYDQYGAA